MSLKVRIGSPQSNCSWHDGCKCAGDIAATKCKHEQTQGPYRLFKEPARHHGSRTHRNDNDTTATHSFQVHAWMEHSKPHDEATATARGTSQAYGYTECPSKKETARTTHSNGHSSNQWTFLATPSARASVSRSACTAQPTSAAASPMAQELAQGCHTASALCRHGRSAHWQPTPSQPLCRPHRPTSWPPTPTRPRRDACSGTHRWPAYLPSHKQPKTHNTTHLPSYDMQGHHTLLRFLRTMNNVGPVQVPGHSGE